MIDQNGENSLPYALQGTRGTKTLMMIVEYVPGLL